jgi:hypothetical protein
MQAKFAQRCIRVGGETAVRISVVVKLFGSAAPGGYSCRGLPNPRAWGEKNQRTDRAVAQAPRQARHVKPRS